LNEQLDNAAVNFIKDTQVTLNNHETRIELSELFKYYKCDFKLQGKIEDYIKKYMSEQDRKNIEESKKVSLIFRDYNWDINN